MQWYTIDAMAHTPSQLVANEATLLFYEAKYREEPHNIDLARRYAVELAEASADLSEAGHVTTALRLLDSLGNIHAANPQDLEISQAKAVAEFNCLRGQALNTAESLRCSAMHAHVQALEAVHAAFPEDPTVQHALAGGLRLHSAVAISTCPDQLGKTLDLLSTLHARFPGDFAFALAYAKALRDAIHVQPPAHATASLRALGGLKRAFPDRGELDALEKEALASQLEAPTEPRTPVRPTTQQQHAVPPTQPAKFAP